MSQNKAEENPNHKARSIDDFLVIPDEIRCVGADGKVFERYDRIHIARDIVRNERNRHISFTPHGAILYFEKNDQFLPSFALSCNILAYLFVNKDDEDAKKVLMQYRDYHAGYNGVHTQNTLVNWKKRKIRHYPLDAHFPISDLRYSDNVNQLRHRSWFGFNVNGFDSMDLENALKRTEFKDFIVNLTGLENPEVLVEIGKYFGKPARIQVPNTDPKYPPTYTTASHLGCFNDYFYVDAADYGFNYCSAASGVRKP